jgi:excisionase family DNA binding protein
MKTLDLLECADFLKIDRTTLLRLANAGEITGAKIGRAWVFLEDDVVAYLKRQAIEQTRARALAHLEAGNEKDHGPTGVVEQTAQPRRARGRAARTPPPLPGLPSHGSPKTGR